MTNNKRSEYVANRELVQVSEDNKKAVQNIYSGKRRRPLPIMPKKA